MAGAPEEGAKGIWNSERIRSHLAHLLSEYTIPLEDEQVQEAAVELRLGPEAYISGAVEKERLDPGDMIVIKPGQMGLLLTEESVQIPLYAMAFISLKTTVKVPGLVNVSGFHVDPGFEGRLIFTVYNAGTETLAFTRGQRMFLMWLADLSAPEPERHQGKRQNQASISATDIGHLTEAGAAPVTLKERIRKIEITLTVYGTLLIAFLLAVVALLFRSS